MLSGCAAPQKPVQPEKKWVWPEPPLEPVVRFIGIYRSESDLETKTTWKDAVLGEEEGQFFGDLWSQCPVGLTAQPWLWFADPTVGAVLQRE